MLKITLLYLIGLSLLGFSCTRNSIQSNTKNHSNFDSTKGLKDYYSDYFRMGVAVSPRALKTDEGNLVTKHFSSMTAENVMKMGPIHPLENQYNWADADSIFAFANRNNIKMRGHTLCWHSQTPKWFFTDSITGKQVTKEVLLQRLKDHIFAVAG
ncbi:MAG: endo-1,4-beta-xylanase, partial [Bacteroidota bacterium]